MSTLKKNDIVELEIDDLSSEGAGVAHCSIAVFVTGALPGEIVEAKILKVSKRCAWAKITKILKCSQKRIKPQCEHYRLCGGCNTAHMSYEAELTFKQKKVTDALQRIGKFDVEIARLDAENDGPQNKVLKINDKKPLSVMPTHPSNCVENYRNKSAYPVGCAGIGMYRSRSHEIIPVNTCKIQSKEADKASHVVSKWMQKFHIAPYNEKNGKGLVRHVFVRTNKHDESLVCLVINAKCEGDELPHKDELIADICKALTKCKGLILNFNNKNTNVILGRDYYTLWGSDSITDELCGLTFKLNIPSFFQVNREQAEAIYSRAISVTKIGKNDLVLDMYCGVGTISLCMAKHCKKVLGVEIVSQAIECAKENAKANKIDNVEFTCADAGKFSQSLISNGVRPVIICVDPPRAGLDKKCLSAIKQLAAQKLIYISCKPSTLARDLAELKDIYSIKYVEPFDMFPRTHHVETLVIMERI